MLQTQHKLQFGNVFSFGISFIVLQNETHVITTFMLILFAFDLHLHINYSAHIWWTVASKFQTHPILLALMYNLGAHDVLPEGVPANVYVCV